MNSPVLIYYAIQQIFEKKWSNLLMFVIKTCLILSPYFRFNFQYLNQVFPEWCVCDWLKCYLQSQNCFSCKYLIGQVACLNKFTSSKFLRLNIRHTGQIMGVFAHADCANRLHWGLGCWHFGGLFRDVGVGDASYTLLTTFWNYWFPKLKKKKQKKERKKKVLHQWIFYNCNVF